MMLGGYMRSCSDTIHVCAKFIMRCLPGNQKNHWSYAILRRREGPGTNAPRNVHVEVLGAGRLSVHRIVALISRKCRILFNFDRRG
jgi:hypothetical protein